MRLYAFLACAWFLLCTPLWTERRCRHRLPCLCGHGQAIHGELALELAPTWPRFWKRYVDNTCCILRTSDVDGPLEQHTTYHKIHHGAMYTLPQVHGTWYTTFDGSVAPDLIAALMPKSLTRPPDPLANACYVRNKGYWRLLWFGCHLC